MDGGCDPSIPNLAGHKPVDYANSDAMKQLIQSYATKYEDRMKEKEAEEKRRFPLELRLKEKIIGQEAAIATVASGKSGNCARLGWSNVCIPLPNKGLSLPRSYPEERGWLDRRRTSTRLPLSRLVWHRQDRTR